VAEAGGWDAGTELGRGCRIVAARALKLVSSEEALRALLKVDPEAEPGEQIEFSVQISETERVQDPKTGVFTHEHSPGCREFEWRGTASSRGAAHEAAMAAFQAHYGDRPFYYRSLTQP
jgi:hypothetical protein